MKKKPNCIPVIVMICGMFLACKSGEEKTKVQTEWDRTIRILESSATIQTIPNPSHARGSALHDPLWNSLRDLNADYVRYSPWGEYPNLKIAALDPPSVGKTSWDFTALDPMFIDFMNAVGDRPVIMNYQAIPGWMLVKPRPENPTREIGSLFMDPTGSELAGYFARIAAWYANGGFHDEYGKWHPSGHNYQINYWEILNEPDHESINMTRELYTALYDVVAEEIRKEVPDMKFMGLSMSNLPKAREWTEYFLDQKNHKPGIPLDMVSYHMYATLHHDKLAAENYPHTIFMQADNHLETIRIVDSIRQELSPLTRVDINESGILLRDVPQGWGRMNGDSIPDLFWNLSAAYYAYIYAGLAKMGIGIIGKSTMWSDPSDWPEVSVLDWKTGKPNARYHVLKMILDNFKPGDKLVATEVEDDRVFAQGFLTSDGDRKLLLINKSSADITVSVTGAEKGKAYYVGPATGLEPPVSIDVRDGAVILQSFGVAVVLLPG